MMNPQTLSWTIIGMASLLLALSVVVLARLRWIQTRPMKACIVLSVFAHLLLISVFHFSRLFDLPFIPGGEASMVVHVTLDDLPEILAEASDETEPPPAPEATSSPAATLTPLPVADETPLPEPAELVTTDEAAEPPENESHDPAAEPEHEFVDERPPPLADVLPLTPPPLDAAVTDVAEALVSPLEQEAAPPLETLPIETPEAFELPDPGEQVLAVTDADRQPVNLLESDWQSAGATHQVPQRYRDRVIRPSEDELARRGGNPRAEAAVEAALNWLRSAQQSDGRWSAVAQGAGRGGYVQGQNRGTTGLKADTGITGLALLAFLGAGHTPDRGSYRASVGNAIEFLISKQDAQGNLCGDASIYARMYCHGIAALSLCEAAAITGDDAVRDAAQRAIEYTVNSQHRQTGGWRYSPGDRGDTSQFGWQLMALVSAREAGLEVPELIDARLKRFLRSVQRGNRGGLASYRPGHAPSRAMTAEALACRLFLNSRSQTRDREAAEYISSLRPGRGPRNFYYWYYATIALSQLNNDHWPDWNRALQKQLLPTQRRYGQMAGSWDPNTVWGGCGGRVYSTALATLCLESYYRYAPSNNSAPDSDDRCDPPHPVADGWNTRANRR